jgi:hypothetical protein
MQSRCEQVCIVAHSQDAAIADRLLLAQRNCLEKVPIFTLGSGVGKLAFVEALLKRRQASSISAWAMVPCMLLLTWGTYMSIGILGEMILALQAGVWWERLLRLIVGAGLLISFAGILAIPIFWLLGLGLRPLENVERPQIPRRLQLDRDYYATADPVPSFVGGNGSTKIRNRHSTLFDHSTYFENLGEFVGSLIVDIAKFGHIPLPGSQEAVNDARTRRLWRIQWLSIARTFAVIASLVVVFSDWLPRIRVPELDPGTVAIILKYVGGLSESSIEQLGSEHPVVITASTIAVGFAVIWGLYWLMSKIWKWWEADDLDAYFARAPYKPLTSGSICFWFVLALCIEFAMLYQFRVVTMWGAVTAVGGVGLMLFLIVPLVRDKVHQDEQFAAGTAFVGLAFLMLLPTVTVLFWLSSSPG